MTSAIRLRMLVVLDRPAIQAYDPEVFAERLHYDRPIAASLEVFRLARATTGEVLERLDDADWQQHGSHPEHARYTVEDGLRSYAAHAHDHAGQFARARASATR